ncbi:MAG: VOC family protein [Vicinamibacterales bacterium]
MHRSQLAGFIIDCNTEDLDAAARFWGEALGLARVSDGPPEDSYVPFRRDPNGINIEVQKVDHESRVHLDIESDDVEAEAARLEKLGARKLKKVHTWWVMEAPTGQRFCIVRAKRSKFQGEANVWP